MRIGGRRENECGREDRDDLNRDRYRRATPRAHRRGMPCEAGASRSAQRRRPRRLRCARCAAGSWTDRCSCSRNAPAVKVAARARRYGAAVRPRRRCSRQLEGLPRTGTTRNLSFAACAQFWKAGHRCRLRPVHGMRAHPARARARSKWRTPAVAGLSCDGRYWARARRAGAELVV